MLERCEEGKRETKTITVNSAQQDLLLLLISFSPLTQALEYHGNQSLSVSPSTALCSVAPLLPQPLHTQDHLLPLIFIERQIFFDRRRDVVEEHTPDLQREKRTIESALSKK